MVEWLLDCKPRDVQIEAVKQSYYANGKPYQGFAYFMEMRTGKTPTILNDYMLLKRDHGIKNMIVVSPNKYKAAWKLEAERFGVDAPCHVFESTKRKQAAEFLYENQTHVLSLNYEALVSDKTVDLLEVHVGPNTLLVADESVALKNRAAKTTRAFLRLSKRAGYVRIATGKPLVQGPHDAYSQLRMIGQLEGTNYFAFRNRFCVMGGFKAKQVVGVKNPEQLGRIMRDRGFVAKRKDWMDVHDSDFEVRNIEMTEAQAVAYEKFDRSFVLFLEDAMVTADQAVTKHMKLQQLSSGFMYDEFKVPQVIVPMDKLPKFKDMQEAIDTEITGKTIVVAIFRYTISELVRLLGPKRCAVIQGGMKPDDVEEEKRRFNEDKDCRILIGQIKAIKYGHTLMGNEEDPCHDIYYFENSYSLDDRAQSEQRPQGHGQSAPIHIVDYATCEVERKIAKALQRKEKISEAILGHYYDAA